MDSGIRRIEHRKLIQKQRKSTVFFHYHFFISLRCCSSLQRDNPGIVGPASKGHMSTSKGQVAIQGGRTLAKEFPSIPHLIHVEILNCSVDATVFRCSGHSTKPLRIQSEFIKGEDYGHSKSSAKSMECCLESSILKNLGPTPGGDNLPARKDVPHIKKTGFSPAFVVAHSSVKRAFDNLVRTRFVLRECKQRTLKTSYPTTHYSTGLAKTYNRFGVQFHILSTNQKHRKEHG